MLAALKQEVDNDPEGMDYEDMTYAEKVDALKQRAMDTEPETLIFNFGGTPVVIDDQDIETAGIK